MGGNLAISLKTQGLIKEVTHAWNFCLHRKQTMHGTTSNTLAERVGISGN